jgi:hypothetical protein
MNLGILNFKWCDNVIFQTTGKVKKNKNPQWSNLLRILIYCF